MNSYHAWISGPKGRLAPAEQAKLWALRKVLQKEGGASDQYQWMASQVSLLGGGHPTRQAVAQFFARVDADKKWYPGKREPGQGRPQQLTKKKRSIIARSAMSLKRRKVEPSYDNVIAQCPHACVNPSTGRPFSRNIINQVLTSDCYDNRPSKPWRFQFSQRRRPLTQMQMAQRLAWARRLLRENHSAEWYCRNIIWADICSKIIPGNQRKANEQDLLGRSKKKRLISSDARSESQNMGGTLMAAKQCSYGDTRVYFYVVMTRGQINVHTFTDVGNFPGETQDGAAKCVNQLPQMLTSMLGPTTRKPRMLFTDRGPGFYHRGQGVVTGDYDLARRQHGYGLWAGTNATSGPHAQPPDIADVLLHETAISWFRARIDKSAAMLKTPWEETPKQLAKRFRAAVRDVNATCDVEGLCSSFPKRLAALVKAKGDRLRS